MNELRLSLTDEELAVTLEALDLVADAVERDGERLVSAVLLRGVVQKMRRAIGR